MVVAKLVVEVLVVIREVVMTLTAAVEEVVEGRIPRRRGPLS